MIVAVAGNQRENMIFLGYFYPGIKKGRGLGPIDKAQKTLVTVKGCRGSVPICAFYVDNGEDGILAQIIEGIEINGFVGFIETFLFIRHERLKHIAAAGGDMVTVYGDVPPRGRIIRLAQRKQRADFKRNCLDSAFGHSG